jgi:hypothetical protein
MGVTMTVVMGAETVMVGVIIDLVSDNGARYEQAAGPGRMPGARSAIPEGIWSWKKNGTRATFSENEPELTQSVPHESAGSRSIVATRGAESLGTDSKEFKARAVALWKGGKTQADAIKAAAEEMGIALKQSYSAYPGSHFDRWRKQGFWSKEGQGAESAMEAIAATQSNE